MPDFITDAAWRLLTKADVYDTAAQAAYLRGDHEHIDRLVRVRQAHDDAAAKLMAVVARSDEETGRG